MAHHINSHQAADEKPKGPHKVTHRHISGYRTMYFNENDELHNEFGPALIETSTMGVEISWYIHGELHRRDGPAYIAKFQYHSIEKWYIEGAEHREDGPAYINISNDRYCEIWLHAGRTHRIDGPAITKINDKTKTEEWYINGRHHRLDGGPTMIWYKYDRVLYQFWHTHGSLHRQTKDNAPAIIKFDRAGAIISCAWYAYGRAHRVRGPAVSIFAPNRIIVKWIHRGRKYTAEQTAAAAAEYTSVINSLPLPIAEEILYELW